MDSASSTDPGFVRTFAHIGDPVPASDHSPFWKHWFAGLVEHAPVLRRRAEPDSSDTGATHEFESVDRTTIGARLVLPREKPWNSPRTTMIAMRPWPMCISRKTILTAQLQVPNVR